MIASYSRPQLIIREVLQKNPQLVIKDLHAFIYGPQYDLFRCTKPLERAKMKGVLFQENSSTEVAARQVVPYEGINSRHIVDLAYAQLFAENLEGSLWTAASHVNAYDPNLYDFRLLDLDTPNKIKVVRRGAVISVIANGGTGQITNRIFEGITYPKIVFPGSGYALNSVMDVPVILGAGHAAVVRLTVASQFEDEAGDQVDNVNGVVTGATVISPGYGYGANEVVTFSVPAATSSANIADISTTAAAATLISELHGRPLKVGEAVYTNFNKTTTRRTIRAFERELIQSHYGTDAAQSDKKFFASAFNPTQTDAATFGNVAAPPGWNAWLSHTSIAKVKNTGTGSTISYSAAPEVEITEGNHVNAPNGVTTTVPDYSWPACKAGIAPVLVNGYITDFIVSNPGAGYFDGGIVEVKVTTAGSGYSVMSPPKIVIGSPPSVNGVAGVQAQGVAIVATGGAISRILITDPGAGYTAVPDVEIIGSCTVEAVANAILSNGVTGIHIGTATSNTTYTEITKPKVHIAAPLSGGVPATAETILDASGLVVGCRITNPGTGYGFTVGAITVAVKNLAGTVVYSNSSVTSVGTKPVIYVAGADDVAALTIESTPEDWNGLLQGSSYNGKYAERYTILVTRGGSGSETARVRIRSASGGFTAENVMVKHYGFNYVVNDPALGGLVVELVPPSETTALRLGDQFSFVVTGKYHPLELSESGQVLEVNVIDGGEYELATTVTFADPPAGGRRATGIARKSVGDNDIVGITITDPGEGYIYPPAITVSMAPIPPGSQITTQEAVLEAIISTPETNRDLTLIQSGDYVGPSDTRYKVEVIQGSDLPVSQESFEGAIVRVQDTAGIDGVQEITVAAGVKYPLGTYGLQFMFPASLETPGGLVGHKAVATFTVDLDGAVNGVAFTAVSGDDGHGDGYAIPPTIVVPAGSGDPGGSGANLQAVVIDGKIVAIRIISGGSNYSAGNLNIPAPITYQGGLRKGDTYYVDAIAHANTGPASIIVLNGQAVDITGWTPVDVLVNFLSIEARTIFSGPVPARGDSAPDFAWTAGTNAQKGILVRNDLMLQLTDRTDSQWVPVKAASKNRLFAHWRGLVPANSGDAIRKYYSESDIITKFGINDIDNPACYGAVIGLRSAQEKPIYVGKVATDDLLGYSNLLRQAETIEGVCFLAPMTLDYGVCEETRVHVNKVSAENYKLWRRAYVATRNPGPYAVAVTDEEGVALQATITANANGNVRVVAPGADFLIRSIKPGDLFRTQFAYSAWGTPTYQQFVIETVLEEDELILSTGPNQIISPAIKFEIWRPDTGLTQAEYVGTRSETILDRRAMNVWTDTPVKFDETAQAMFPPQYYEAAEIAGLRSALLPQQGLTMTELQHSLDSCPLMFTKYTQEELDIAAAKGTFIVTQEYEDGPVFIRHQLTTDTNNGLLYYEDSIGVNLDAIAYAVKWELVGYIGKRNANREAVEEISTRLRHRLDTFKEAPKLDLYNIGPALIDYSELTVALDKNFADRITISVKLQMPAPINIIDVTLVATTIQSDVTVKFTPASAVLQTAAV